MLYSKGTKRLFLKCAVCGKTQWLDSVPHEGEKLNAASKAGWLIERDIDQECCSVVCFRKHKGLAD